MNQALVFDILLALLIAGVGLFAVVARGLFTAVMFFVSYGILLAIAWVRGLVRSTWRSPRPQSGRV